MATDVYQVTIYHRDGFHEVVRGNHDRVWRARDNAISHGLACSGMDRVEQGFTVEFNGPKGWEIYSEGIATIDEAVGCMKRITGDDLVETRITAEWFPA